ncbi:alpha/beta-hydrolase [Macrolepiota fuliginosa MF-IS2]|uniref:Alpha/beta-hydrolase n=1 Tax=Macrolepiota fuliginosa MF-IS2 TaxID=1400762 RepID=A0A9P5XMK8_9AGAR|nr:alpha/beta-hydrolase [Macrolepiota fuliginosa MF-IS2]
MRIVLPALLSFLICGVHARAGVPQTTLHHRNFFYVGAQYVKQGDSTIMEGAMYVERLTPQHVTQPFPLLIIHGRGMTGTNFLNTPDGRRGWGDFFLSKGYEIYLIDQPARARSPFQAGVDGPQSTFDTYSIESRFTATGRFKFWPQATLHTQWPGNGSMGDPVFDAFYASTVPSLISEEETSVKMKNAGSSLLDKIGPVVLMTHSQAGALGWVLGDSRPDLVKSIVALEPVGPPFVNAIRPPVGPARPFGIAEIPITYDPPVSSPGDIKREVIDIGDSSLYTCFQQAEPARKLVNLMNIPTLVVTSEAGYHTIYDSCTVNYLEQAGVGVDHMRLEDVGIHGNGHMMFMEKNNIEIAELVEQWIAKTNAK